MIFPLVQAAATPLDPGEFVIAGILAGVIIALTKLFIDTRKNGNGKIEERILEAFERAATRSEQAARSNEKIDARLASVVEELSAIRRDLSASVAGQAALHGLLSKYNSQIEDVIHKRRA